VFTLTYASLRCDSNTLSGCVPGCVSNSGRRLEAFRRRKVHHYWCNCVSTLSSGNSSGLESYIDSPICCAVENTPQEIVFSLLTPPIAHAKVTSTCAAVPFGEVRSHSRVPVYRSRTAMFGRTSQPLAMLCVTWSEFREARRGPLQPIGRRLFRSAVANDRQSRFSRIEFVDQRGGRTGLIRVCGGRCSLI
jgi:hypothetical protein